MPRFIWFAEMRGGQLDYTEKPTKTESQYLRSSKLAMLPSMVNLLASRAPTRPIISSSKKIAPIRRLNSKWRDRFNMRHYTYQHQLDWLTLTAKFHAYAGLASKQHLILRAKINYIALRHSRDFTPLPLMYSSIYRKTRARMSAAPSAIITGYCRRWGISLLASNIWEPSTSRHRLLQTAVATILFLAPHRAAIRTGQLIGWCLLSWLWMIRYLPYRHAQCCRHRHMRQFNFTAHFVLCETRLVTIRLL